MKCIKLLFDLLKTHKEYPGLFNFLLFGSNELHKIDMGHKPGTTVIINKKLLPFKKQSEYLLRIFLLDYFILFFQEYIYFKLNLNFDITRKVTFIILEGFIIYAFHKKNFTNEIIDLYKLNSLKQLLKEEFPLKIAHLTIYLTYAIAVLVSTHSYIASTKIEIFFVTLITGATLLFCDIKSQKIKKSELIRFMSNSDNNKSIDNVSLDKDITITSRTKDIYKINLCNSELFICENDNIMILVSKNQEHSTKNPSSIIVPHSTKEIVKNKCFDKSLIDHIQIGKAKIKFNKSTESWSVT